MKNKELERDLDELFKLYSEVKSASWVAGMFYPNKKKQNIAEDVADKFIKLFCEIKLKY